MGCDVLKNATVQIYCSVCTESHFLTKHSWQITTCEWKKPRSEITESWALNRSYSSLTSYLLAVVSSCQMVQGYTICWLRYIFSLWGVSSKMVLMRSQVFELRCWAAQTCMFKSMMLLKWSERSICIHSAWKHVFCPAVLSWLRSVCLFNHSMLFGKTGQHDASHSGRCKSAPQLSHTLLLCSSCSMSISKTHQNYWSRQRLHGTICIMPAHLIQCSLLQRAVRPHLLHTASTSTFFDMLPLWSSLLHVAVHEGEVLAVWVWWGGHTKYVQFWPLEDFRAFRSLQAKHVPFRDWEAALWAKAYELPW